MLTLLAKGLTREEIAIRRSIAPTTISRHMEKAREKLGARTTLHAVVIALVAGVIE